MRSYEVATRGSCRQTAIDNLTAIVRAPIGLLFVVSSGMSDARSTPPIRSCGLGAQLATGPTSPASMALSRSVLEQQCAVRAGGLPLTVRGLNLHLATQNGMDIGDPLHGNHRRPFAENHPQPLTGRCERLTPRGAGLRAPPYLDALCSRWRRSGMVLDVPTPCGRA